VGLAALGHAVLAAQTSKSTDTRDPVQSAADACEAAVGTSMQKMRGKLAQRVQFLTDQRQARQAANAATGSTGTGQYQGPNGTFTPFTYDGLFHIRTDKVTRRQWRK
jgi:hypothetical protein